MRLSVGNLLRATVGFVLLLLLSLVSFPASAAALDELLRDGEAVTVAGCNYDDALPVLFRSGEAAARASAPGTDRSEDRRADHRDLVGNYDPSAEQAAPSAALDDVLPHPTVTDPKLQNYVDNLYKGTTNSNRLGTGTTADAVRNELTTGLPTGGTFHSTKAQETINGLTRWLRNNPNASYSDRLVAQSLLDDLVDALGTTP